MNSLKTISVEGKVPDYGRPINRVMIQLSGDKLLATISLKGMPFESASEQVLENSFSTIKNIFNQLCRKYGANLSVWTHIVKKKDSVSAPKGFKSDFAKRFVSKYIEGFEKGNFYKTDYYISFVYKFKSSLEEGENDFFDLLKMVHSALLKFEPIILDINDDGSSCQNIEFLSALLNADDKKIPLTRSKVKDILGHSDWHFGYDVTEIRNAESKSSKYAVFFDLEAFPLHSYRGMYDFVLEAQCEFVLTQSVIMMNSQKTIKMLDGQKNKIESSDSSDKELSQIAAGREGVAIGEVFFGDFHSSLAVYGDDQESAIDKGTELNSLFGNRGVVFNRANLKSMYSLYSMLPGATKRITPGPRTMTNLVCGFSLHNYSRGKPEGNPIGDGSALMPLKTMSDTLFHLNLHPSENGQNSVGKKYAGHTLVLGTTGAGKTTLLGSIAAFATRFDPQIFTIDYNRSTELFMRAYGAEYFNIEEGIDTGLNPFQLDDSKSLRSYLNRLLQRIGSDIDGKNTDIDIEEISAAVNTTMTLPQEKRGMSTFLQSIQQPHLRSRFSRWCRSEGGDLSWCLDSKNNKFDPSSMDRIGFDTTVLLEEDANGKIHPGSEAILSYLFYLKGLMQKEGRLLLTIVEEFWMPANQKLTQNQMKKGLKAGRLKSEFMVLSSQSPEDAINCEIFAAIVQQTATKIFLPNPSADWIGYKTCNVTKTEFDKIQQLDTTSRTFLIKQSNSSCFAKLDLFGFDEFLPIISGTEDNIVLCEKVRERVGGNPDKWIPELLKEIKQESLG